MPYNIIVFISRKPTISHSEFERHYECTHIPLLKFYGQEYFPRIHRRHYPPFNENARPAGLQDVVIASDVDAIAEISFDDEAAFQAFMSRLMIREVSRAIRKDEEKFVDPGKIKIFVVRGETKSEAHTRTKPFSVGALLN